MRHVCALCDLHCLLGGRGQPQIDHTTAGHHIDPDFFRRKNAKDAKLPSLLARRTKTAPSSNQTGPDPPDFGRRRRPIVRPLNDHTFRFAGNLTTAATGDEPNNYREKAANQCQASPGMSGLGPVRRSFLRPIFQAFGDIPT